MTIKNGLLLCLWCCACAAHPTALAEGSGRGIIAFDPTPPAGAELFERPSWQLGDHFTLLRGGRQKLEQRVVAVSDAGYELEDQTGGRLFRDLDLATLGEAAKGEADMSHRLAPRDVRYLWPLWVGKSWKCEYVEKTSELAVPFVASYVVEGEDQITVPAGSFRCLRVRRTAQRAGEDRDQYYEGTMLLWYAPEIGIEARQIIGGLAIDLLEWTRGDG